MNSINHKQVMILVTITDAFTKEGGKLKLVNENTAECTANLFQRYTELSVATEEYDEFIRLAKLCRKEKLKERK